MSEEAWVIVLAVVFFSGAPALMGAVIGGWLVRTIGRRFPRMDYVARRG